MKATYTIKFRKWKDGGTRDEHEWVDMKGVLVGSWGSHPPTPSAREKCHFGDCVAAINEVQHHRSGYDPDNWLDIVPLCEPCHSIANRAEMKFLIDGMNSNGA